MHFYPVLLCLAAIAKGCMAADSSATSDRPIDVVIGIGMILGGLLIFVLLSEYVAKRRRDQTKKKDTLSANSSPEKQSMNKKEA